MKNDVCITGVGAVTPLGNDFPTIAGRLLAGESGVVARSFFDAASGASQSIGTVGTIPPPVGRDAADFAALDRLEQLALSCAADALRDAGLDTPRRAERIGVVMGLGAEHLRTWELDVQNGGSRAYEPCDDSRSLVHFLRDELELGGPAVAVAAACASGGFALEVARRWLKAGWIDVCLAGGCDLASPMAYAGFYNLRALSRRGGDPAAMSRPFDRGRDGFVMGEGGAVFVLETADHARRRDARTYALFDGFGAASDASHMVIPCPDARATAKAISLALADAQLPAEQVDYVNAHAAGTPVGDRAEAAALHMALGDAVANVPVSSTKSMTGHLLSGAAAVEALACLVALERQAIPPTINLDEPDPECDLCHVARHAREGQVRTAISNSLGFGGSNTCIVLRKAA